MTTEEFRQKHKEMIDLSAKQNKTPEEKSELRSLIADVSLYQVNNGLITEKDFLQYEK